MAEGKSVKSLPAARISFRRRFALIWLVPLVAGVIAVWLVYKNLQHAGPTITIRFADGKGLQVGRTVVRYRGVSIGTVNDVELSKNAQVVEVKVRLEKSAAQFAQAGSAFWIVRADVGAGTLRGLDTIVGGPYIQAQPGEGPKKKEFSGLEHGPIALPDGGLDFMLTWPQLGWLNAGAPVYYRGVEVGVVQDYSLGAWATNIVIHVHIQPQFAPLVRADSKFWNAGGIKADLSLFGGVSVSAESLKSLLVGGIAFATPSPPGAVAVQGAVFPLYEKADDKWLKWSPPIQLAASSNQVKPEQTVPVEELPAVARAMVTEP